MSGHREDLLALQVPALAALLNMGLVKRALKEIDAGNAPSVTVDDKGTVIATFDDGTCTTLPRHHGLRDAPCTCGAPNACRHRAGAVLAYQQHVASHSAEVDTETPGKAAGAPLSSVVEQVLTSPVSSAPAPPWSPGDVDDEALLRVLGAATVNRAAKQRRQGYIAEVRRGTFLGDDLPVAHLQTSSVRFLIPKDVAYARCDCTQKTGCLHVALAVWAFQEKDRHQLEAAVATVQVSDGGDGGDGGSEDGGRVSDGVRVGDVSDDATGPVALALQATSALTRLVLGEGFARLPQATAGRVALARDALERAKLAWPLLAVDELASLLDQYQRRSALFSADRLRDVLVEMMARVWATSTTTAAAPAAGSLPRRLILGADEALATKLDQGRFIGIGATVREDGDHRHVDVLLCDPSGQGLLVMERHYRHDKSGGQASPLGGMSDNGGPEDGPALSRRAAAGASLALLAGGQTVSNAVTRHANRSITFGVGGLQKTSVTRGGFNIERLPADRVIRRVEEALQVRRALAPRWLRPRLVAESVAAVVVHEVQTVFWDPGPQAVVVVGHDVDEQSVIITASHRAVRPGAVQALARLAVPGHPLTVVGQVEPLADALHVEAISVVDANGGQLVVLDFEAPSADGAAAHAALPLGEYRRLFDREGNTFVVLCDQLLALLAHMALQGLHVPHARRQLAGFAAASRHRGLRALADDIEHLVDTLVAVEVTGTDDDVAQAADAWGVVCMTVSLLRERT